MPLLSKPFRLQVRKGRAGHVSRSVLHGIQKHVQAKAANHNMETVSRIVEYLNQHQNQAEAVLACCESGFVTAQVVAIRLFIIPKTRTHINVLAAKFLMQVLLQVEANMTRRDLILRMRDSPKMMLKIFCVVVCEPPETPVWTHDGSEFIGSSKARYMKLGRRLKKHRHVSNNRLASRWSLPLGGRQWRILHPAHLWH